MPDNHDSRIRHYELMLKRDRLDDLPRYDLPKGYRFAMYRHGDRDSWIAIEHSAKELMGHTHAIIPTQTTTWVACKLYLDFGLLPIPENARRSRDGWRIIRALTDHPALQGFEPAAPEENPSAEEQR